MLFRRESVRELVIQVDRGAVELTLSLVARVTQGFEAELHFAVSVLLLLKHCQWHSKYVIAVVFSPLGSRVLPHSRDKVQPSLVSNTSRCSRLRNHTF